MNTRQPALYGYHVAGDICLEKECLYIDRNLHLIFV